MSRVFILIFCIDYIIASNNAFDNPLSAIYNEDGYLEYINSNFQPIKESIAERYDSLKREKDTILHEFSGIVNKLKYLMRNNNKTIDEVLKRLNIQYKKMDSRFDNCLKRIEKELSDKNLTIWQYIHHKSEQLSVIEDKQRELANRSEIAFTKNYTVHRFLYNTRDYREDNLHNIELKIKIFLDLEQEDNIKSLRFVNRYLKAFSLNTERGFMREVNSTVYKMRLDYNIYSCLMNANRTFMN